MGTGLTEVRAFCWSKAVCTIIGDTGALGEEGLDGALGGVGLGVVGLSC